MCVCVSVCTCRYVYVCGVCMCTDVCSCEFIWLVACYNDADSFVQSEPVTGDPDPIRIRVSCGPDIQAIRRPTHRMIQRFVLVRAVKTGWQFGSKTASFHVSACFCIISLFIVVSIVYMLLVLFHLTV